MPFNNKDHSYELYSALYELGVYAQPGDTIAVSNKMPKPHIKNQYIVSFPTFQDCISYVETELKKEIENFVSIWDNLENELDEMDFSNPNKFPKISDDLTFSFINSLIAVSNHYEELKEIKDKLMIIKNNIIFMCDNDRSKLSYYSPILQIINSEIFGENMRLSILKHINSNNNESKIKSMLKFAYYSPYGIEEGIGPRGRNNPMTPFGGYDYWYDRVMDGRDLHDYSGGHATEKFLGPNGYNKFRRYPELLRKTRMKLRTVPYRYLDREQKRKLKRKKRKHTVSPTGVVRRELERDPTHYFWWDETVNNPYAWKDRDKEGVYPTWEQYR